MANYEARKVLLKDAQGRYIIPYTGAVESVNGVAPDANGNIVVNTDEMIGATASTAGKAGLVPAPEAGGNFRYLRGDGTWQTVDVAGYLPLTGGTLTGNLKIGPRPIYNNNSVQTDGLTDELSMAGDAGDGVYGAVLSLRSTKDTYNPGGAFVFTRTADTGSNVGVSLELRADGTAYWHGGFFRLSADGNGFIGPRFETSRSDGHVEFRKNGNSAGFYLDTHPDGTTWYRILTEYGSYSVSGQISAASFKSTSDRRQKDNIQEVAPDLSSLKAYSYVLKADGQKHVGLVAQEVEPIIPEAVSEDERGVKALDYNAVVAALVAEVNALKKRVSFLEKEFKHE